MAKTKISEYSATAADNTDIAGIDIAEGCLPSGINNAIRTLMSDLKDLQAGTSGDTIPIAAGGTGATTAAAARTALGATTVGSNVFTAVDAAAARTAIGAGTSSATGTVTSVSLSGGTTGLTVSGSPITTSGTITLAGTLAVANGGTGVTTSTGTGAVVLGTSPTLVTPVLGTPTSGTLSGCTVDGTNAVGFSTIPQNSQSTAYTLVLADSGKHILHPSADTTARTFTIPANGSVAYPVGTAITFINQNGAGVVTIAITTDTMRLSPAGTTGSRTLAANGSATAVKITSTEWLISGSGLT